MRVGAGPPPPRPRASSVGTKSTVAIVMRASPASAPGSLALNQLGYSSPPRKRGSRGTAHALRSGPRASLPMDRRRCTPGGAFAGMTNELLIPRNSSPSRPQPDLFQTRNLAGRNFALAVLAPAEHQDPDCDGKEADDHDPPDVPDQRKAGYRREERVDNADRAVARHLDGFIGRLDRGQASPFHVRERVDRLDPGQYREIVGRRRRRGRPREGPPVPRVAGQVAADFAGADADIELRDLAEDAEEDDDGAGLGDKQQRLPARVGDVLQAPRHALQAQHIERHEGEVKADQPAPEARLAPALVEGEAER